LPGDIFLNAFGAASAEILGAILGGIFLCLTQLNLALMISFSISSVGAYLLV
jgi:hypothetical protein